MSETSETESIENGWTFFRSAKYTTRTKHTHRSIGKFWILNGHAQDTVNWFDSFYLSVAFILAISSFHVLRKVTFSFNILTLFTQRFYSIVSFHKSQRKMAKKSKFLPKKEAKILKFHLGQQMSTSSRNCINSSQNAKINFKFYFYKRWSDFSPYFFQCVFFNVQTVQFAVISTIISSIFAVTRYRKRLFYSKCIRECFVAIQPNFADIARRWLNEHEQDGVRYRKVLWKNDFSYLAPNIIAIWCKTGGYLVPNRWLFGIN